MGLLKKNEVEVINLKPNGIEDQEEREYYSFKSDFEMYASEATIHGLRFLPEVKYAIIRRFIWFVLILSSFSWSLYAIIMIIGQFLEYGVTATVKQVYLEELPFPAVTICNFNKYRLSYTVNNTNFSQWLYEVYSIENVYFNLIPPDGELVAGINRTEFMLKAAHQKEKMIQLCTWKGKSCSPENFTTAFTDFGVCYTFNGDPENVLTVDQSGLGSGLELQMDMETIESNNGDGYIEGFVASIHNQDEPPNLKYRGGIFTATGRQSVVGLQKAKISSLPSPYSTKCQSSGTKYQKRYSRDQCYIEKAASLSEEVCGCIEPYMPGTARICNFNESYYCFQKEIPSLLKTECRDVPCENIIYHPQVSTAKLPSTNTIGQIVQIFGGDLETLKDNFAGLSLFYLSMSYEEVSETALVSFEDLIAEIGGIMGICLGASFLSFYESLEFLFLLVWKRLYNKKQR